MRYTRGVEQVPRLKHESARGRITYGSRGVRAPRHSGAVKHHNRERKSPWIHMHPYHMQCDRVLPYINMSFDIAAACKGVRSLL